MPLPAFLHTGTCWCNRDGEIFCRVRARHHRGRQEVQAWKWLKLGQVFLIMSLNANGCVGLKQATRFVDARSRPT